MYEQTLPAATLCVAYGGANAMTMTVYALGYAIRSITIEPNQKRAVGDILLEPAEHRLGGRVPHAHLELAIERDDRDRRGLDERVANSGGPGL